MCFRIQTEENKPLELVEDGTKLHVRTSELLVTPLRGRPSGKWLAVRVISSNVQVLVTRRGTTHFQPCSEDVHAPRASLLSSLDRAWWSTALTTRISCPRTSFPTNSGNTRRFVSSHVGFCIVRTGQPLRAGVRWVRDFVRCDNVRTCTVTAACCLQHVSVVVTSTCAAPGSWQPRATPSLSPSPQTVISLCLSPWHYRQAALQNRQILDSECDWVPVGAAYVLCGGGEFVCFRGLLASSDIRYWVGYATLYYTILWFTIQRYTTL